MATRARARDLVLRREVLVDDKVVIKPALLISDETRISVKPGAGAYVSRGALKLRAALSAFGLDANGRIALDVGASTGGFTEVLLAGGAVRVYAVDNGRGQLHPVLQGDSRVIALEGVDARKLTRTDVPEDVNAIVADLSFIALSAALPVPLSFAAADCWLVALIKPQFEAGRDAVPKSGVIRDPVAHQQAVDRVRQWLSDQAGWRVIGVVESPITGGDGNREFLIGAMHARS